MTLLIKRKKENGKMSFAKSCRRMCLNRIIYRDLLCTKSIRGLQHILSESPLITMHPPSTVTHTCDYNEDALESYIGIEGY